MGNVVGKLESMISNKPKNKPDDLQQLTTKIYFIEEMYH